MRDFLEQLAAVGGIPIEELMAELGPLGLAADADDLDWADAYDEDDLDDLDDDLDDGLDDDEDDLDDFDDEDWVGVPAGAGSDVHWPALRNPLVLEPQRVDRAISDRLDQLRATDLRNLAGEMGWPVRGQRRDDLQAQMAAHYRDPAAWRQALERLDAADRHLLSLVAWQGVVLRPHTVAAIVQLGAAGLGSAKEVTSRLVDLHVRGWLLNLPAPYGVQLGLVPELAQALLPVPDLTPAADRPPSAAIRGHADPVTVSLNLLFAHWVSGAASFEVRNREPVVLEGRGPQAWLIRERDKTRTEWGTWLPIPAVAVQLPKSLRRFLPRAVPEEAGGLLTCCAYVMDLVTAARAEPGAASLLQLQPERLVAWTALSPTQQLYHLVDAWLGLPTEVWSELSQLQLAGARFQVVRRQGDWQFRPEVFNSHLRELRWSVLQWLRCLPRPSADGAGSWVAAQPALSHLATALGALLLPPPTSPWGYEGRGGQRLGPEGSAAWQEVGRPVLEYFFEGPLSWLGLVDTARGRRNALSFRLTASGAALLDDREMPVGAAAESKWQGDGQLLVPPIAAALPVLTLAARYGVPTALRDGRVSFAWSGEQVAQAFGRGEMPADIAAAFERAGAPVHPKALASLEALAAGWGNVNLYQDLAIMTFADAVTAREVAHRAGLDRAGVCQVNDTCWLVRAADVPALVATLRASGHTPRVEAVGGPSTEPGHGP